MSNYIAQSIVVEALKGHKGQFIGMTVDKKAHKVTGLVDERRFVYKVCKENSPAYKDHSHLVSIREANGAYRSFDTGRVKRLVIGKTLLEVT